MMKRSKSTEARQQQAIEQKSALLKNVETADFLKIQPLTYRTDVLASFSDVSVIYDVARSFNRCHSKSGAENASFWMEKTAVGRAVY